MADDIAAFFATFGIFRRYDTAIAMMTFYSKHVPFIDSLLRRTLTRAITITPLTEKENFMPYETPYQIVDEMAPKVVEVLFQRDLCVTDANTILDRASEMFESMATVQPTAPKDPTDRVLAAMRHQHSETLKRIENSSKATSEKLAESITRMRKYILILACVAWLGMAVMVIGTAAKLLSPSKPESLQQQRELPAEESQESSTRFQSGFWRTPDLLAVVPLPIAWFHGTQTATVPLWDSSPHRDRCLTKHLGTVVCEGNRSSLFGRGRLNRY